MSELGQMLKNARIERGYSLDDLQEMTKIRKRYLESIEEGNYKVLPGNFYVRAFIKSYAEAVGLDPGEVLQLYGTAIPSSESDSKVETIAPKRRAISRRSDKWSRMATGIIMFSFLILIVGVIYFFANRNYNSEGNRAVTEGAAQHLTNKTATEAPAQTQKPASSPSAQAAQTPKPIVPEVKFIRSEKGVDYYEVRNAAKLSVELSLIGKDCWFQIDKLVMKNNVLKRSMIEQGGMAKVVSPKTWEVDTGAYLNLGLPTAVELKVNGVTVELGDNPNPKRLQFVLAAS